MRTRASRRTPLSWIGVLLAALSLCAATPAHADLIHLINGKVLQGEVVSEDADFVVVKVPYGTIKIRRDQIEHIEKQTEGEYRLDLGQSLLIQKRYAQALEQLEAAYAEDKETAGVAATLKNAYADYAAHLLKNRRLDEAEAVYKRLEKLAPDSPAAKAGFELLARERGSLDELVGAARRAGAGDDPMRAIMSYEKALAFSPDAIKTIGPELARARARLAEALYRAGRFQNASTELEKAFALDPALADSLERLYAASALSAVLQELQAGQTEEALKQLDRLLSFAPANRLALYVAGRTQQALGHTAEAGAYFARGLNASVRSPTNDEVTELRGKLEQALKLPAGGLQIRFEIAPVDMAMYVESSEGAFKQESSEHFQIYHHNDALAREVEEVLEAHRARICGALGLNPDWKSKARVVLYRTQEEYCQATQQPAWTGGTSRYQQTGDGVRMEIHSWQTSSRLLKSVLPHEVTHLILNSVLGDGRRLPRALHEGFAVLMEPSFRHGYYLDFLRQRMKSEEFIPVGELLGMDHYPPDPQFLYAEGFALVAWLVDTRGQEKALEMVTRADREPSAEKRLLAASGYPSLERLEAAWKTWLASR